MSNAKPYPPSDVDGEEQIYRRVKYPRPGKPIHYVRQGDILRVTAAAFHDATGEISVNRATYCIEGPRDLIEAENDGVVALTTKSVRDFMHNTLPVAFTGHVKGSSFEGNLAHADMSLDPHTKDMPDEKEKKAFKKFCEYLKKLGGSNWAIEPPEPPASP